MATGAGVAALWLGLIPSAQAEEAGHVNSFEFAPFLGYMGGGSFEDLNGSNRGISSGLSYGIFINMTADVPERQYELLFARQSTEVRGDVTPLDLDIHYVQIGGTVSYPQSKHVHPYVGATIGGAWFSPGQSGLSDEARISFSFGGGVRFPITDRLGIRFDARAFVTLINQESEFFCASVPPVATCNIRAKSDTLVQYNGSLGVTFGF